MKKFLLTCLVVLISGFAHAQLAPPSAPTMGVQKSATTTKKASKPASGESFAAVAPAANLSWTAPASGCTGTQTCTYNIYRGPTSGSETLLTGGVTNTNYTDSAVTRGSQYCYQVSASNSVGEGPKGNEVCVTIPNVPSAPGNLTVTTQ